MKHNATTKPVNTANQRKKYVNKRLLELGMDWIELNRAEAHKLPSILHKDEEIGGVISGRGERGHIMIVATDRRVIILDCKPLFDDCEDVAYAVVAGVSVGRVGPFSTVTLYTRLGDFKVKTLYTKAAKLFKRYIDKRCIEHPTMW